MPSSLQLLSPNINLQLSPPSLHIQTPQKKIQWKLHKNTPRPEKRKTKSKTIYYNKHTDFHKFQNHRAYTKDLQMGYIWQIERVDGSLENQTTKHKNNNLTLILPLVLKQKYREATKLVSEFVHTNSCCCCVSSVDLFSLFPRKKVKIFWKKLVLNPLLLSWTTWADSSLQEDCAKSGLQIIRRNFTILRRMKPVLCGYLIFQRT